MAASRASTARVGRGTKLGTGTVLQDWVEVGLNPTKGDFAPPVLGKDCTLRSHTVVYRGTRIGDGFQSGHGAIVREGTVIGKGVSLGTHSILERDAIVEDGARIHSGCFLPEYTKVRRGAWIGPCVVVTNVLHPPCPQFKMQGKDGRDFCVDGPDIGANAKIGAGAILMPGLKIGENALVGGGAVVTRDVPANAVVSGNPAVVVKEIPQLVCHPGHYQRVYEWEDRPPAAAPAKAKPRKVDR